MEDLKTTISKNLVELRTKAKLTQLQLAEILNYSDKAVSKWERGEAIPDIRVLVQIADFYGITLDDLVRGRDVVTEAKPRKRIINRHAMITALSAVFVWFVALILFAVFYFITHTSEYAYLVFVIAPLPMGIVLVVFSSVWGNRITHALSSSVVLWACAIIVHVFVYTFSPAFKQIFIVYVVAAVFEVLIILWFVYRWYAAKKH